MGQFFVVGAQMTGSLEQTTQIILDISCVTAHVVYAGTNKTKIIWIKREQKIFFYPCWMPFTLQRYVAFTVLFIPKPFGGRWQHWWTAAQRKRVPHQWHNQFWQTLEEGAGKRGFSLWGRQCLASWVVTLLTCELKEMPQQLDFCEFVWVRYAF